MPWPLLLWGLGAAAAAAAGKVAYDKFEESQEEERAAARRRAEERARREQANEARKKKKLREKALQELNDEYGGNIHKETSAQMADAAAEIPGSVQENRKDLETLQQPVSDDAKRAEAELNEFGKMAMKK